MKETDQKLETTIQVVKQAEQLKQQSLVGKLQLRKGHVVWEFNRDTLEIAPAEFEKLAIPYNSKVALKTNNLGYFAKHTSFSGSKIIIKKNCVYVPALNKKNVVKILNRDFGIVINQ